jgi:DNA-binding CsgD family transcriptional regulator
MLATGRGDLRQADHHLRATKVELARPECKPAHEYLLIAEVARLHADGSRTQRAALFTELRSRRRSVPILARPTSAPVLLHYGLAAIWAHDAQVVRVLTSQLTALSLQVSWARGGAAWLHGLLAEAEGDLRGAHEHLASAARTKALTDLPLYRAHALLDCARVAEAVGATAQAQECRSLARHCYRQLGAAGYLEKLDPRPTRAPGRRNLIALSARELEVLTLIVNGLSYAQIGRELFISASTVGYHLSNIYAKTGVNSRHELTDSARRDPISLGLTA